MNYESALSLKWKQKCNQHSCTVPAPDARSNSFCCESACTGKQNCFDLLNDGAVGLGLYELSSYSKRVAQERSHMSIFYLPRDASKARLRDAENARKNRAEILKAYSHGTVSRRDLIKWGLITTGGLIAPIGGLSPF